MNGSPRGTCRFQRIVCAMKSSSKRWMNMHGASSIGGLESGKCGVMTQGTRCIVSGNRKHWVQVVEESLPFRSEKAQEASARLHSGILFPLEDGVLGAGQSSGSSSFVSLPVLRGFHKCLGSTGTLMFQVESKSLVEKGCLRINCNKNNI